MLPPLSKRLAAEVIGTFGFFFIGFCGIAALVTQGPDTIQAAGIAVGFGFGLALMIFAFGHISGGHFNPAVTIGLAAARRFPAGEVVPYWIAQVVGGLLASVLIRVVFDDKVMHAVVNVPGGGVSDGKAFVLELVFTFLFVLVIATVATDARAAWNGVFAPFAIGLFVFVGATVVGPMTGASFNVARSLTPAIIDGTFDHLWLYIVAPLAGGAIGGIVHAFFREPERRPEAGAAVDVPAV